MNRRVYLDHNATAPLLDAAREAMLAALSRPAGNPSSPHAFGHQSRIELERSRRDVAALFAAPAHEVVFTSGGTEADNLAIQGSARAWTAAGRPPGHIVASAVEHPAVLESCRYLETVGWRFTLLPVDGAGRVNPDDLARALSADTALVSIMAANNETGVLQPVAEIAAVTRAAGVPLHVDAVQAAGRGVIEAGALGADLIAISSHKIGGPAGIGALWVRETTPLAPVLRGGGQERRRRAGTEAPLLAAGFAAAARSVFASAGRIASRVAVLRDRMEHELTRRMPGLIVQGAGAARLGNTSSLTVPGVGNETLVIRMDLAGFAISTGSACSTGATRPSHVLSAMGVRRADAASTVRISLGPSNTDEEIDALVETLTAIAAELSRGASASRSSQPVLPSLPPAIRPSRRPRPVL